MPWITLLLLSACAAVLAAAGGVSNGLNLEKLLAYGAKATSLIFDKGQTWRLLSANLLHKDIVHFGCNAFVLWNVGGALERAVRPADYLATLFAAALGTTLASALGGDSVSLGASGLAFGVLGASATFGWRRGVRGELRSYFGVRLLPWLAALFAVGLGSRGVDNWGHAGGLAVGLCMGVFMEPRMSLGEGASRRLAAALGAASAAVALGAVSAPFLPVLGEARPGPLDVFVRVPLGWRRAGEGPDRISYTNGLAAGFRASATIWVDGRARGGCAHLAESVRALVEDDLWRLLEAGPLTSVELQGPTGAARLGGQPATRIDGTVKTAEGGARLSAVCAPAAGLQNAAVAVISLEPAGEPGKLAARIAETLELPPAPDPVPRAHSRHEPSAPRSDLRASPVPRLSRPTRGHALDASPALSDTSA